MTRLSLSLLLPGLLLLLPPFLQQGDLVMFPGANTYNLIAYNDNADSSGASLSSLSTATDSLIVLDYTLRRSPLASGKTPYAGIVIDLPPADSFLDISRYRYLHVDVATRQGTSFKVHLKMAIPGFTRYGDFKTYHFLEKLVDVQIGTTRYTIPLTQFQAPEWWYKSLGANAARLSRPPDFTKFFGINFQSKAETPLDLPDQFRIARISFSTRLPVERNRAFFGWISGFIAYMAAAAFALIVLGRRRGRPATIPYQPVDLRNQSDEEYGRLEKYIGSHFQEPELSVDQVGRETGINPVRIPLILQQKQGVAFKPYLNKVRLTEAKRLLRETDRNITEIAFAVGYNSVPHFNRIFRQEAGASPTEFRGSR